ncbi:hypothetical protein GCM10010472_08070 [Pseudonocardia halophobica]|uniref:Uncharacterized protein n=1 Tax=Pseudonocardia halophobica TaxID=29401 RepID=A0A9W6L3L3_9PSEU|nr:hypothetical protein [Pseudonocardia halophobica]GLL13052.1 hypothetical protein GCM10017577_41950 [Pseudonocardia halophobica]
MTMTYLVGIFVIAAIVVFVRGDGGRVGLAIVAIAAALVFGRDDSAAASAANSVSDTAEVVETAGSVNPP